MNIVIRLRKLGKDLRGREIEMMDHGAGVVGAGGPVLAVVMTPHRLSGMMRI